MTERWTTFWALVVAAAQVVRAQKRLLLFPVLALLSLVFLYAAIMLPFLTIAAVPWSDSHLSLIVDASVRLLSSPWFLLLWMVFASYAATALLTFAALALTSAALQALREGEVSVVRALAAAFRRVPAILGFAALVATMGMIVSAIERRSHWLVRASVAAFGLSWTLISLFALPAMINERRGTLDSVRRGTALFRATWAEGRLTPLGLGLLWLPIIAAEGALLSFGVSIDLTWRATAIVLCGLVNVILWVGFWLLERVYVAAVYCFATEGVVPAAFRRDDLLGMWRAIVEPAAPPPSTSLTRPPVMTPRPRHGRTRTRMGVATLAVTSLGFLAWDLRGSDIGELLFPGAGLSIDAENFPDGPHLVRSRPFALDRGELNGIASVQTAAGPMVFVFGNDRMLQLDHDLKTVATYPLPAVAASLSEVEPIELSPGKNVFVGINSPSLAGSSVTAIDQEGRLVFQRSTPGQDGVDAVAPVRIGSTWGVAVGYNGFYGLCLLDSRGVESWCNRDVGNVWVVTTADCNDDHIEDIVSLSDADSHGLGCYGRDGSVIETLHIPTGSPYIMRGIDLDGDGRKELAYFNLVRDRGARFGAFDLRGKPVAEVYAATASEQRWLTRSKPIGVRHTASVPRDVVVLGPSGEMLGVTTAGQRWRAGTSADAFTVIDLDGDGSDEVITLSKRKWDYPIANHTISVWTWRPGEAPAVATPVTRLDKSNLRGDRSIGPSAMPVRPFARHPGELDTAQLPSARLLHLDRRSTTREERDYRLGCYTGVGATLRLLPKIAERDHLARDLAVCDEGLAELDVSRLEEGADYGFFGCHHGVSGSITKYQVADAPSTMKAALARCTAELNHGADQTSKETAIAVADDVAAAVLPMSVMRRNRLSDTTTAPYKPVIPAPYDRPGARYSGYFDVCVSTSGAVTDVTPERGTGVAAIDRQWEQTLRTWRFRPFSVYDTRIKFCGSVDVTVAIPSATTASGGRGDDRSE
jgi:hypothetical protein